MTILFALCLWLSAVAEAASLRRHRRRGLRVSCIHTESGSFCSEVDDDPLGSLNDSRDDDGDSNRDSAAGESKDGLKPGVTAAIVLSLLFFTIAIGGWCYYKRRGGYSHQDEDVKEAAAMESKSDNAETATRTDEEMSKSKPADAKRDLRAPNNPISASPSTSQAAGPGKSAMEEA